VYQNANLTAHLNTSNAVEVEAAIYSEINMNYAENISIVGNYRNRPAVSEVINGSFGTDNTNKASYEGYTDSDIVIDGGYDVSTNVPAAFSSIDIKKKLLFSLEDCFQRFRPRSGINKAVSYGNFLGHFSHNTSTSMMQRPRYYIADKNDAFKYWTSFRTEQSGTSTVAIERGISNKAVTADGRIQYYIDDAAPFIVYKNQIPVNRIIIKMQTHVGDTTIGNIYNGNSSDSDPLYDTQSTIVNRTVPINWKIQYLENNVWQTAKTFTNADNSSSPLIGRDGYIELHYSNSQWSVGSQTLSASTPFFTDFNNQSSTQFKYIKGLRVVVDTMSKLDVPFELIELSPRLAINMTDITKDYTINKIASDLGVSGLPVGQLLASTGSITIADFDQVLNTNNANSVIAPYVKRNMQVKFYEVIKNVPSPITLIDYYVPIKTMYAESFPEIKNDSRTATIKLRDLYFYFESLTAPQTLFADVSFSYAIAMLLDSIGFSNYIYKKSDSDKDLIIPYFYIGPNTTVAEVLQQLAISSQTAMFFDEENNFVLMSKSYMLAELGDRLGSANAANEVNLQFLGSQDSTRSGRAKNRTTPNANLANIIEVSSKDNDVFNDGKIIYTSRYIQKTYKEIRQANLLDEDKVWVYKPALLWEIAPSENTKSINEEKSSQGAYTLSAIPLNSNLTSSVPTVNSSHEIINNVIDMGEAIFWMPRYNGYFYSNGEIIKFDAVEYSVSQPSTTPELVVSLANTSTNIVSVTTGDISGLKVGDKIVRTGGGTGKFGPNTTVTSINKTANPKTFTVVSNHTVAAPSSVNVIAKSSLTNYWISSVDEYQDYFSKVPFNGKIYPTGKVRIFAEPNYETISGITRLKEGAVAQHGRGQFNTEIKEHIVGLPGWINTNVMGCQMNGKLLFDLPFKETFIVDVNNTANSNKGSDGKKIYLEETSRKYVRVGQKVTGTNIPANAKVTDTTSYGFKIDKAVTGTGILDNTIVLSGVKIYDSELIGGIEAISGMGATVNASRNLAQQSTRTSLIRNFMSSSYPSENQTTGINSTQTGKVQSSALVMAGPTFGAADNPRDFMTYVYNTLDGKYTHFGTRMRVVGTLENNLDVYQSPAGSMPYYALTSKDSTVPTIINGGGGGIGIFVNPLSNTGYFFELSALTVNSIDNYIEKDDVSNLHFYKVHADITTSGSTGTLSSIPQTLWRGRSSIVVDDGRFTGQYRDIAEENPSVYDLSVEYEEVKDSTTSSIKFYLYVNGKLVGSVVDDVPLQDRKQNVALFIRGTSKCMFEHLYALKTNEASNYSSVSNAPFKESFSLNKEYETDEAFSKYSLPQAIQDSYLSGISPISTRSSDIYYEEFGTIMREAAYFDIKYDKAYPALLAKIAPTFNKLKGYAISGFVANAYGAEFLIFNTTDKIINLDNTSGNYLRILGVTFTQEAKHNFTVDEYFQEKSNLSDPEMFKNQVVNDPLNNKRNYQAVKNSRMTYGKKEFNIDSDYIQSQDAADSLMSWLANKVIAPRLSLGIRIFANPTLQLGDIVTLDYKSMDSNINEVVDTNTRFVVYNIEYSRSVDGPEMTVYVSEIPTKEVTA